MLYWAPRRRAVPKLLVIEDLEMKSLFLVDDSSSIEAPGVLNWPTWKKWFELLPNLYLTLASRNLLSPASKPSTHSRFPGPLPLSTSSERRRSQLPSSPSRSPPV